VAGAAPGAHVTRADGRSSANGSPERAPSAVCLCDRPDRSLDLYMVEIPPGSSLEGETLEGPGEQAVHVLNGWVRIGYGAAQVDLGPGDTGQWEILPGITYTNLGAEPARLVLAALGAASHGTGNGAG
jgi:hypothetical protein